MALEESVKNEPHLRKAQKALAEELTLLVHGEEGLQRALKITDALFKGDIQNLSVDEVRAAFADVPSCDITEGIGLIDALVEGKVASSKREARELLSNSSISINGIKCNQIDKVLNRDDTLDGSIVVIRKGKKNYSIFKF